MPENIKNIVDVVSTDDGDAGRVISESLRTLRKTLGLTQKDMAKRLNVGQAAISKIEKRGDVQLSTLEKYVTALGASLRIDAVFSNGGQSTEALSGWFDKTSTDEDQLVFPIFGDDLFPQHRDVVLSIRPHYTEKILTGEKTIELRRRFPISAPNGTIAYIYSTSPVRAMVGCATIVSVKKLPLATLWKECHEHAAISRNDFFEYFDGLKEGYALNISEPIRLSRPLELPELREKFGFEPPQSFLYARPSLRRAVRDEFASLPN